MKNLTPDDIVNAIRDNLSPDLLSAKWNAIVARKPNNDPMAGHCAIATEALYDLLGGPMAGYTPYVCAYYTDARGQRKFGKAPQGCEQMTHWWLRGPQDGQRGKGALLDPTVSQYKKPFPYENGRPSGFMSPTPPSKRARDLVARVEEALGAQNIHRFREKQIADFKRLGGRAILTPANKKRRSEILARRF